jgi:hypothetical protein
LLFQGLLAVYRKLLSRWLQQGWLKSDINLERTRPIPQFKQIQAGFKQDSSRIQAGFKQENT